MFTRFKSNTTTLFLDPNFEGSLEYESGTKVNIILSPSLYWVKKLSLPISSVREVKKLLPSIFEDTLPESHYSYTAYKKGDEFIAFAYEDKKIFELLKRLNISYSDVKGVYFAQSEFESLEGAFEVNANESIYLQDSLLVLVPTLWLKESRPLELQDMVFSKHRVQLQQFSHIVDSSSLYKIAAILVIFIIVLMVELFVTKSKTETIQIAKEELFSNYNLQPTMFQNSASMKKYSKIHKTETKLREYISYFLTMRLQKGEKITLIEYKNGTLFVNIRGVNEKNKSAITSQLDSKKVKYKARFTKESMRVEMKL